MRARAFVRCYQGYGYLLAAIDAVVEGIWLGLLRPRDLDAITANHYGKESLYRDDEHNDRGFYEWEQGFVSHLAPRSRVLVGAAGGGREVIALCRAEFEVDAFECNAVLVSAARKMLAQRGLRAEIRDSEPGEVPFADRRFDAAIFGWGAYMHVVGRTNRIRLLDTLRARCCPGARLLISFWTHEGGIRRKYRVAQRIARVIQYLRFSEDPPAEVGDDVNRFFGHSFTRAEIAAELQSAGWMLEHFDEKPYGHAFARATGSGEEPQ